MDYTVRPATINDFLIIQELNYQLYVSEYENKHDDALIISWPKSPEGAAYFTACLTDPEHLVLLASDPSATPVGYLIGSCHNKFNDRTVKTGELNNMFVSADARRSGVGKQLVGALKDWLKTKGIDRLFVDAYAKNENAIHFYESCGFDLFTVGLEMKI